MTALTAPRATPARQGGSFSYPVAAAVCCYAGGLAVLDSSGRVKPAVTGTGLVAVGRFESTADNSSGAAEAIDATVMRGVFRWGNSSGGDAIAASAIGDLCYIVDDQTVAATSDTGARSPAGVVVDVDDAGVWVYSGYDVLVSPAGALLAASNLSDLANAGTARTALGGGANKVVLHFDPVSTKATDAAVVRVVSPVAGTIAKLYSVANGALAAGDATLTAKIGSTAVTNGAITITQSGSAAGDVDSATPTAAHTVAIGDVISITGGGSSTATATASCLVLITPSA